MLVSRVRAKEEGAVLWQAQLTKGLNIRTISAGGNGNLEPKSFPRTWNGLGLLILINCQTMKGSENFIKQFKRK